MFAERKESDVRALRWKSIEELENDSELAVSIDKMNKLGALYHAEGRVQDALNVFYAVLKRDETNKIAKGYVQLMREVLDFVNKDLMNP